MNRHSIAAGMGMLLVTACTDDPDDITTLEADMIESVTEGDETKTYQIVEPPAS